MPAIACRRCGKVMYYEKVADLKFFPFCSSRCKMVDLAAWLREEHRIPGPEAPPKKNKEELKPQQDLRESP